MKNQPLQPDDAKLTALLRASRPVPSLQPRFQEAVWRRIQRAETESRAVSWLEAVDQLAVWLLRPRRALAGIAALIAVGVLAGAISGISTVKQTAQERYLAAVAPRQIR